MIEKMSWGREKKFWLKIATKIGCRQWDQMYRKLILGCGCFHLKHCFNQGWFRPSIKTFFKGLNSDMKNYNGFLLLPNLPAFILFLEIDISPLFQQKVPKHLKHRTPVSVSRARSHKKKQVSCEPTSSFVLIKYKTFDLKRFIQFLW